jgi:hypothetical protein
MPSSALSRILAATRPYVPFQYKFGDEVVDLTTRKLSGADNEVLTNLWQETYKNRLAKSESEDTSIIFSQLKRYDASQLAKYIAQADRRDLAAQASMENDDKPLTDEAVKARTDELVAEREAHINAAVPVDEMLTLAMQRRAHFDAANAATNAVNRAQFTMMVYDAEGAPLADSYEALDELPSEDFVGIFSAALTALAPPEEKAPDPLL